MKIFNYETKEDRNRALLQPECAKIEQAISAGFRQ